MQGLLDTQKPLDGQIFNIATMSTRETVAKETRSKIEEAFLNDDPYRDIEVFRNLFEVDDILSLQNKFVRNIKPNKMNFLKVSKLSRHFCPPYKPANLQLELFERHNTHRKVPPKACLLQQTL